MRSETPTWNPAWVTVCGRSLFGWARSRGRDLFGYEVWEFYDASQTVYLETVLRRQLIFATEEERARLRTQNP
jgi:hypothetical protein